MQAKTKGFDGGAIFVNMRNDVNVVTGMPRSTRHRHAMDMKYQSWVTR